MNETTLDRSEREILEVAAGWSRLQEPAVFRVTGQDPRQALQRIVTQDLAEVSADHGRLSLLLAPKGQVRALMAIFELDGELLLVGPPGRGSDLVASMERFLGLSRCRLETVAGAALLVAGPTWGTSGAALDAETTTPEIGPAGWGGGARLWLPTTVLGVDGTIVAGAEAAQLDPVVARLDDVGSRRLTVADIEGERVRRGFPAWGAELEDDVLPPEVGIDRVAVSNRKGCYIGQETMARLETYGQVNRSLVGVAELDAGVGAPQLPAALEPDGGGRSVGRLTSWVSSPDRGGAGLALVRRQHAEPGTVLVVGERRVRVVPFPLW